MIYGTNRLRMRKAIRDMLERPPLKPVDLAMSLLVRHNTVNLNNPAKLPVFSLDQIDIETRELYKLGIRAIKIFTDASQRDLLASEGINRDNLMVRVIKEIKNAEPNMCVMTELCLCPYTHSGDCVIRKDNNQIDFEGTHAILSEMAIVHAEAGADIVGPAGMLNGSVKCVRAALDQNGYSDVAIKPHIILASCLYELYRKSMSIAPPKDARRELQTDVYQIDQSVEQTLAYIREGADMVMFEPGLFSADIIASVRKKVSCPILAFSASGEYFLLRAKNEDLAIRQSILLEALTLLKRAGSDLIVTYAAKEVASCLNEAF